MSRLEELDRKLEADRRRRLLLERAAASLQARDSLLDYARLMHPDPNDYENVNRSKYVSEKHHRVIVTALEEVERGGIKRLIINCPPRHGKSELASKLFPTWFMGRHPEKHMILGTYNETFSWEFGRECLRFMRSPQYRQAFPEVSINQASVDRIGLHTGGVLAFTGRGGTITGRGGHGLLIDDPIKDRREADSQTIRDQLWTWYSQVMRSRMMTDEGWIVLIQTRWHEDDLVGRITDRENPHYNEAEAKHWHVIDLPALAEEDDPLGRNEGEALWPQRFSAEFLKSIQRSDPRGFNALYQGRPAPEDGAFFRAENLRVYHKLGELPENLRKYAASDHAVSEEQNRDKTCCLVVGVDDNNDIWVMPEIFWERASTDKVVEAMLFLMRQHKPLFWWAEKGHISKSIGPFLRKRMLEMGTFCSVHEMTPTRDKQTRAQSIQARTAMQKVHFPAFTTWWPSARDQLLKFPQGTHDDFVDALAYIGLGLDLQAPGVGIRKQRDTTPRQGTLAWVKWKSDQERRDRALRDTGGF